MTCAKQRVFCTLITPDGGRFMGENWCAEPQPTCPRLPGEGYEKCWSVCGQEGHAEEVALKLAGEKARGAHAYIEGHDHACRACQIALFGAGVAALTVGPPPERAESATPETEAPMLNLALCWPGALFLAALWEGWGGGTPKGDGGTGCITPTRRTGPP